MLRMKRESLILSVLFLFVFLSSGIFAEVRGFVVDGKVCPSGQTKLMGFSDLTNAHGELAAQTNYDYSLCLNFAGSLVCSQTLDDNGNPVNKVIGLSSTTNAHAEVPILTAYTTNVCYGDLSCIFTTDPTCPSTHNLGILSLSGESNAHIGAFADYTTKICCTSPTASNVYWSKNGNTKIDVTDVVPGTTQVKIVVKNLAATTAFNFEIWEEDTIGIFGNDDEIITGANALSGTTNANGNAVVPWIITQKNLDDAGTGDMQFYFKVLNQGNLIATSQNLEIRTVLSETFCDNIQLCESYDGGSDAENNCIDDVCSVATSSVGKFSCDPLAEESCYCDWDATDSSCSGVAETLIFNEAGEVTNSVLCAIEYGDLVGSCSEGAETITSSWTGIATLDGEVIEGVGNIAECNGIEKCESCLIGGTQEVACPSLIQLPFFGAYNFVIAGLLITLIYVIFNLMEKQKKSLKNKRRR